jgi:hypothetical protein
VEDFVRKVMAEERYEEKLFTGDNFSSIYFSRNAIYWQDYQGNKVLNQTESSELRHLAEKMIQRWFAEKTSYLDFLQTRD